jgi:glycopeptide antibiotics resistance protein
MPVGKQMKIKIINAAKLIFTFSYFTTLFYLVFFIGRRRIDYAHDINLIPIRDNWNNLKYISEIGRFNYFSNIIGNILLFIPLPVILKMYLRVNKFSTVLLFSLMLSIIIESLQYIFKVGVADIDDVILNCLGACLGYFFIIVSKRTRRL